MARDTVRFRHHGARVDLDGFRPTDTVLDYLRLQRGLTGTKEGCAEGDCGACTVVLGQLDQDGRMTYAPVNSCILMLGQLDGRELITIEDLGADDGSLHPIQRAMVDHHGSQCGFCTPGIVMSLYALFQQGGETTRSAVNDQLAGNLCRCTGYGPIVAAAQDAGHADCRRPAGEEAASAAMLAELRDSDDLFIGTPDRFLAAPAGEAALARLLADHPDATIIAGATDVGLWVTKQLRDLPKAVLLHRVTGLDAITERGGDLVIGAGATYADAERALAAVDPDLGELLRRIGSKQVRAAGTIGGNIANGSPIGDMPPALIALDAVLELASAEGSRDLALEDFFLAYGRQDRRAGEYVRAVRVPSLASNQHFRCYKISKRFDQDISAVMAAFRLTVDDMRIVEARVAFGGMAATPKRAKACEQALANLSLEVPETWAAATAALVEDFQPIDDMRASAYYRREVAKGLVLKALSEVAAQIPPTHGSRAIARRGRTVVVARPEVVIPDAKAVVTETVGRGVVHDSAEMHVRGTAPYIDDVLEPAGTLHLAPGHVPQAAKGRVVGLDLDPVRAAPGVVAVLTAGDIPGTNDCSPSMGDDPILADGWIAFHGQVLFVVAAETRDQARRAARLATVEVAAETPAVTVEDGLATGETVLPPYEFGRGDVAAVLAGIPESRRHKGSLEIGGQEHFYLEGQVALAQPLEGGGIRVHSSTQHPTEVQHLIARMLDIPDAFVVSECRRMGGAFGGKESQAAQWACLASLVAARTGRPAKIRLDRDDDMIMTGKRHDMRADYTYAHDSDGVLSAVDVTFNSRCGCSADLSLGVNDRTMFHADNAYFYPAVRIRSKRIKTDTVSNTAFRGFGGPQGVLFAERMMEEIAIRLGRDPLDIRLSNLYARGRDVTPYGMTVPDSTLPRLVRRLARDCRYRARRRAVRAHNADSRFLKKGLALTPVKFGIAFTLKHLNQAGALVHVYTDGSVQVNHGGTEMGQGLHTKVAQVVAEEFGLGLDRIRITATSTEKVPNTGPTAASSGSDLNGMAAKRAAEQIRRRLAAMVARMHQAQAKDVVFVGGAVHVGYRAIPFAEVTKTAFLERVSLSAAGYYATPKITWDRESSTGRPFLYFSYGAACAEVTVDTLTGEMIVDRVDILHDVGRSLNPALDIGQIEGGFVQGMGWLTTEELVYDRAGRLMTHAPSTYKIPTCSDVPDDFRVALWDSKGNREATIYRSKAVGEPPLMLATSVYCAINDALASLAPGRLPPLDAPATPEAILRAARAMEQAA